MLLALACRVLSTKVFYCEALKGHASSSGADFSLMHLSAPAGASKARERHMLASERVPKSAGAAFASPPHLTPQ